MTCRRGRNLNPDMARALFIHRGALGDLVLFFPLLTRAASLGMTQRILVTSSSHGRLCLHLGLCEVVLDYENGLGYGLCACQEAAWIGYVERFGVPKRVVAALSDQEETFYRFMRSRVEGDVRVFFPRPDAAFKGHVADYMWQRAGMTMEAIPESCDLWKQGKTFLLHPGSGSSKKNYPPELFLALRQRWGQDRSAFLLGPIEREAAFPWSAPTIEPKNLVELAEELKKSAGLISHDSGVAHLSAWLGVPTVAFHKTTDPAIWGVRGKRAVAFSATSY